MTLVFDLETDGFVEVLTKIHSLVMKDTETGQVWSCADHPGYTSIAAGLKLLTAADMIVGHNIICFDIPAIQKVHPGWSPTGLVRDTLVLSRLIWSDLRNMDFDLRRHNPRFPGQMIGRHSLEAWGYRIGNHKGDYGKSTDWSTWTSDMQTYCEQDVALTEDFWKLILTKEYSEEATVLEHKFQTIIHKQEQAGFHFNVKKAQALYATLAQRRMELERELRGIFDPWWVPKQRNASDGKPKVFTPKGNNVRYGYVKGASMVKVDLVEFNPGSRDHISDRFRKLRGWKPAQWGKDGKAKVDEDILANLPYPEAKPISEYLMVQKRIGQLAEGPQAWLKQERDGVIYHRVITNGAVTGRCTHIKPNVAQVPSLSNKRGKVPYGRECRELFYAPEGFVMLGCDASGLELRCLAHYMAKYDDGAYGEVILSGDIHTMNMKAAGLPARDPAKTFIYAFLYGAGNVLLGALLLPHGSQKEQARAGAQMRRRFLNNLPALRNLQDAAKVAAKMRGWLKGIDGRIIPIRSQHAALNTLLQGCGAVVMKRANILFYENVTAAGYVWGRDWYQVANIHDEYQTCVRPEFAEDIGAMAVEAIVNAGRSFNFRIPLDAEYAVGPTWADTH